MLFYLNKAIFAISTLTIMLNFYGSFFYINYHVQPTFSTSPLYHRLLVYLIRQSAFTDYWLGRLQVPLTLFYVSVCKNDFCKKARTRQLLIAVAMAIFLLKVNCLSVSTFLANKCALCELKLTGL